MGTNRIDRNAAVSGGVHSAQPSAAAALLLDMSYELDAARSELALHAQTARELRLELAAMRRRHFDHYDLAPVGFLNVDSELRVKKANLAASTLFGIERRSLVRKKLEELFDASSFESLREATTAAFANDAVVRLSEVVVSRPGGLLQATLARADEDVLITLVEAPSSPRTDTQVKAREADLQGVLDALAAGIATVDSDGTIRSCNRRMAALFGHANEGLIGTPLVRLVPGLGRSPSVGHYDLTAHSLRRKFPVEVSISARPGAEGALVVEITDVSQRKREQGERNEALLLFNQIAERIADAFYVMVASSGESLYVSPAFAEIYGRPLVAHRSEPWPRLRWVHEEDRARVRGAVENLWTGGPFDIEYRIVRPDGELRRVHDRAFMLGDQRRVTGILQDVTHQRLMEEELRQSQRLEAMGTLASGVAHDFNNLLMGLGGCVQLALTRLDPTHPSRGYLQRAGDAIVRGANLTRQILRIGETRRPPEGTLALDELILSMQELLRSLLGDSVALELELGANGHHIAAEAADVERILLNLATNARDAMPQGGSLTIRTEPVDEAISLVLRDTGLGMTQAVRARVFEPFFTTKDVGKGTGLGLSTVFALVRRLGGTVGLESVVGSGTAVHMTFPIIEPAEQRVPESTAPPPARATVLVVDDDPLVRLTVENHLEALGCVVLVASTADEAIDICEDPALTIDVMLTDVMMPGMLGTALSEALHKRNKQLPVIYMSAHPMEDLVQQGHLTARDRLLTKPFDANALSAAIHQTLEDAQSAREKACLRIFVIDDNRDIAEGLQEILTLEGHTVEIATNAEDALRAVPEFCPQVVFCDVALGNGMNGFELTKTLRLDPRVAAATFIALTGFQSFECGEQAREAGMQKILTKPVIADKLIALLKRLAR